MILVRFLDLKFLHERAAIMIGFKSAALAVTRRARLPSYRLQFQAPARGCDEKVTHGANVPSRRDS